MNTQSEDNYLVLICIFRLRRCERKKKEKPASGGVFVVWLRNKEPPLLPAWLPQERSAPALTDPEIWLLNCFWPNFCFPVFAVGFPFVSATSQCVFASGVCVCDNAGRAQWPASLATESGDCVALGDTTRLAGRTRTCVRETMSRYLKRIHASCSCPTH